MIVTSFMVLIFCAGQARISAETRWSHEKNGFGHCVGVDGFGRALGWVGMTEFVKNFRKMSALQEPYITDFPLLDLLLSLKAMHTDITWHLNIESETRIKADENMLCQVLTNLIQNAKEAGAKDIDIRFTKTIRESNNTYDNEHKFSLYVSNNGTPIRAEVRREIFIPFFTTKPTGNDIGLPLSRQMMMKQGINLVLCEHAMPGYHTTFALCN